MTDSTISDERLAASGVFRCAGCGKLTNNPERDLEDLRAAGKIACCPERDMRLVGLGEIFDALRARSRNDGVRVLEWEFVKDEGVETYEANIGFGSYRVFSDEDSAAGAVFVEWAAHPMDFCTTRAVSVACVHDFDTAKAAAQADYEQRIRSALEPTPCEPTGPHPVTVEQLLNGQSLVLPHTAEHAKHLFAVALASMKSFGLIPSEPTEQEVEAALVAYWGEDLQTQYGLMGMNGHASMRAALIAASKARGG